MDDRSKRDLPEVVAEILIEQHAMREEISALRRELVESNQALRQEMRESHGEMVQLFNGMTNAILDAMNRGNDRYHQTADEVDRLKTRITKLENPAADAN